MKKLVDIVREYQGKGHIVFYDVRPDGGIIITRIDGQEFKGKEGNKKLRALTGESLSQKQTEQRKQASKKATEERKGLTKVQYTQLKKLQKVWKENEQDGFIRRSTFEYHIKKGDIQRYIDSTLRYAQKLAGHPLVDHVVTAFEMEAGRLEYIIGWKEAAKMWETIAAKLKPLDGKISQTDMQTIINIKYDATKNMNNEEEVKSGAQKIIAILNKY